MKVLILAGGLGTRISEESGVRPKPMVEIGDKPILWHIMKHYSTYDYNDFVILLGYKGHIIKNYFANYFLNQSSVSFDLRRNEMNILDTKVEPWKVTLHDTGLNTLTGGRILRAKEIIGNETFMLTYGDGVADVDLHKLLKSHQESGKICTMTAVQPFGRFGQLHLDDANNLISFQEKPKNESGWINGGFFICEPDIFHYLKDDQTIFEREPLERLAAEKQINVYKHTSFWKCMDTLADKNALLKLWNNGEAQWKTWSN